MQSPIAMTLCYHSLHLFSGSPQACLPEISDIAFSSRDSLPEIAFTRRIRIETHSTDAVGWFVY